MRDQLKRLEELQAHDAKIQELAESLEAIPKKIRATENDLVRVEALLSTERTQLEDTRKYLNDQRGLLEMESNQVQNAKVKLAQAKGTRDATAAQREIEQTRELAGNRETEIKKLIEAMEAKEKVLAERTSEVQNLREAIAKDSEAGKAKISEIEAQIEALKVGREAMASGLSQEILKRYSVIRKRKGQAVSAVRGGTCTACNMNIPPQLFNVLRRGKSIESCPYCQRIIYWEEIMKTDASTPDAKAGAPAASNSGAGTS